MGYRNYIAKLPKADYNQIKDMNKKELYESMNTDIDDYLGPYDIIEDNLHGLGKYVDVFDKDLFKPFFLDADLHESYNEEGELLIVGKEFLEAVIYRYNNNVQTYYKKMLEPFNLLEDSRGSEFINSISSKYDDNFDRTHTFDFSLITEKEQTALFDMIEHIRSMGRETGINFMNLLPYDLEQKDKITTSWKYEYAQFELVRIYKTFDWENNIMVYYGY